MEIPPEFEIKIFTRFFHINCFEINYNNIMSDAENKVKLRNPDLASLIFKGR
jgi:hypothetical protein